MTDDEKRLAIAKACGWKKFRFHTGHGGEMWVGVPPKNYFGEAHEKFRFKGSESPVPYYLDDLNAMHEAEATLTDEQFIRFGHNLIFSKIPCPDGTEPDWDLFEEHGWIGLLKATARQHAEAFLKTLQAASTPASPTGAGRPREGLSSGGQDKPS